MEELIQPLVEANLTMSTAALRAAGVSESDIEEFREFHREKFAAFVKDVEDEVGCPMDLILNLGTEIGERATLLAEGRPLSEEETHKLRQMAELVMS